MSDASNWLNSSCIDGAPVVCAKHIEKLFVHSIHASCSDHILVVVAIHQC